MLPLGTKGVRNLPSAWPSGARGIAAVLVCTALASGCGTAAGTTRGDPQAVGPVVVSPREAGVPMIVPTAAPGDRAAGSRSPSAGIAPGAVMFEDLWLFLRENYGAQPWLAGIRTLSPVRRGVNVETNLVEADGQPLARSICFAVTDYLLSDRYMPAVPAWPGLLISAADGQLLGVRTRADDDCAVSAEEAASYGPEDPLPGGDTPEPLPVPPSPFAPEPDAPSTPPRR